MKNIVLLILALGALLSCAEPKDKGSGASVEQQGKEQNAGKQKAAKIRIFFSADLTKDCKISLEEIEKYYAEKEEKNVCEQLEDMESTPRSIVELASMNEVTVEFSGAQPEELIGLLGAWKEYLESRTDLVLVDIPRDVTSYSFELISHEDGVAVVSITDTDSGQSTEISIRMGAEF